jgi:hypothetical protein
MFAPGDFAIFIAASRVFAGADPLAVAAENNCVHAKLDGPLDVAVAAAIATPLVLVVVAPICAPVERNGAIAQAVATVVASSTTTLEPLFNAEHCPNTAVMTAALLGVPTAPADPPRATRYNTELL